MKKYIFALIKITDTLDHAKELCDGELFCNRIKYFIDCEKKEIGDSKEATSFITHTQMVSRFMANNVNYKVIGRYNILWQDTQMTYNPAYCMYAVIGDKNYIKNSNTITLFDRRLLSFGKYAVIIKDVAKFLKAIGNCLPKFRYGLVNYYDYTDPKALIS